MHRYSREESLKSRIISRDGTIPKKSIWSYVLMLFPQIFVFPIFRKILLRFALPTCQQCDFEPGFRFYYGNHIFAKNVFFSNAFIMDYADITLGSGTGFSKNCTLITAKHNLKNRKEIIAQPIDIGKDVYIATQVIILGGIRIGDHAVVGSGSVVTQDVPKRSMVAGNPARVIKKL